MAPFNFKGRVIGGLIGIIFSFILSFPLAYILGSSDSSPMGLLFHMILGMGCGFGGVTLGGIFLFASRNGREYL